MANVHDVVALMNDATREADEIKRLRAALEAAKIPHLVVDDCWYSCPLSEKCCNDQEPAKCNCGADDHNAKIDAALKQD